MAVTWQEKASNALDIASAQFSAPLFEYTSKSSEFASVSSSGALETAADFTVGLAVDVVDDAVVKPLVVIGALATAAFCGVAGAFNK